MTKNPIANALSSGPADKEMPADLASAMAGDRGALEDVLRWVHPHMVRYCRARLGSEENTSA
jgi:DNA-directed RNA polymerase specialized sigma24 family protein